MNLQDQDLEDATTGNHFILDENHNVVPCSLMTWARWLEDANINDKKHVKKEYIGSMFISTVFLGLDHAYRVYPDDKSPPLIFETMIKDEAKGAWLNYQKRYSTWQEAEVGHAEAVQWVKDGCKEDD